LIDNNYKLLSVNYSEGEFELYDLEKDPNETTNIIEEEANIARKMIREFKAWNETVEASVEGDDYAEGLPEPNGYRVFWNTLPAYEPYFEEWKNRPEYKSILNKKNTLKTK